MDSPNGRLSLESYLDVGKKRAPNFTADTRRQVYPIFERYEREKLRLNRWEALVQYHLQVRILSIWYVAWQQHYLQFIGHWPRLVCTAKQ